MLLETTPSAAVAVMAISESVGLLAVVIALPLIAAAIVFAKMRSSKKQRSSASPSAPTASASVTPEAGTATRPAVQATPRDPGAPQDQPKHTMPQNWGPQTKPHDPRAEGPADPQPAAGRRMDVPSLDERRKRTNTGEAEGAGASVAGRRAAFETNASLPRREPESATPGQDASSATSPASRRRAPLPGAASPAPAAAPSTDTEQPAAVSSTPVPPSPAPAAGPIAVPSDDAGLSTLKAQLAALTEALGSYESQQEQERRAATARAAAEAEARRVEEERSAEAAARAEEERRAEAARVQAETARLAEEAARASAAARAAEEARAAAVARAEEEARAAAEATARAAEEARRAAARSSQPATFAGLSRSYSQAGDADAAALAQWAADLRTMMPLLAGRGDELFSRVERALGKGTYGTFLDSPRDLLGRMRTQALAVAEESGAGDLAAELDDDYHVPDVPGPLPMATATALNAETLLGEAGTLMRRAEEVSAFDMAAARRDARRSDLCALDSVLLTSAYRGGDRSLVSVTLRRRLAGALLAEVDSNKTGHVTLVEEITAVRDALRAAVEPHELPALEAAFAALPGVPTQQA